MLKDLEKYAKYWWKEEDEKEYLEIKKDPFKLLIFTILSQNTSSKNTMLAYKNLKSKFKIEATCLANAKEKDIANAIRQGGLYRIKAKRIKEVSREIKEKYSGLNWIYKMDIKDAKKELKKLKGVGDKTADVIISSIYGSKNAFVVDTHMRRIAIRLGIVDEKATYEEIQNALIKLFPWDSIKNEERTLSLFWLMAKHICNAKKPKCNECILKENCKWYKKL